MAEWPGPSHCDGDQFGRPVTQISAVSSQENPVIAPTNNSALSGQDQGVLMDK